MEKFETELRSESWPIYNQEFTFHLDSKNDVDQQISGKFLVLTAYAILENNEETASDQSSEYTNENFVSKFQRNIANLFDKKTTGNERLTPTKSTKSESPKKHENLMTFEKRRTIGSVTFSIQNSQFTKAASNFSKTTDDIWKNLENMRITTPNTASPTSPNTEAVCIPKVNIYYHRTYGDASRPIITNLAYPNRAPATTMLDYILIL